MGKPRLIILVRHAQSEGNKNRAVHQATPDHRVKLTPQGHRQAKEAGQNLLTMLHPTDTIQFYTSPYLRTRETTTGMLSGLTPHPNYKGIKVYEEPRLREQDFGNFQPCSAEMERIWHERAAYGHFFYRIPNGESAADAYDRVSGFNETLWRQFAEDDFASVLVLVTHGLMTRIFLMKWYHYSVEYFEDLRNVNHCEFIIMRRNDITGKYILQSQLRTWSAYKREQEAKRSVIDDENAETSTASSHGKDEQLVQLPRRWGGCVNGCNHAKYKWYTYGEPNTNNANGDNYGKNGRRTPRDETQYLVQQVRERLEVLGAGRDFGGSRSGAGSDVDDSGSGSGGEEESRTQNVASASSGQKLGNGVTNGSPESSWLAVVSNTAVPVIESTISVEESTMTPKPSQPQPPTSPSRLSSRLGHTTQNTSSISMQCSKITPFTVLLICSLLSLLAGLFLPYIFSMALGVDICNLWTLISEVAFYGVLNIGVWSE